MIVQNILLDGKMMDIIFMVFEGDFECVKKVFVDNCEDIGFQNLEGVMDVVKVLVIGIGMCFYVGVVVQCFSGFVSKGINIWVIMIFEIKIFVLIDFVYVEFVVWIFYLLYGLDG